MSILKWLINILNKDELEEIREQYTIEAREVLEEAKKLRSQEKNRMYIHYDRIDIDSDEFLHGMQPILKNRYFVSWLNEQKMSWQKLIKKSVDEDNKENAYMFSVKMSLIDDIFINLIDIECRYNEMLNQKKEGQSGRTEQLESV